MEFIISLIIDLCKDKGSNETIEKEIKYFMKRVPQKFKILKQKIN